jgi:hypothetical protein
MTMKTVGISFEEKLTNACSNCNMALNEGITESCKIRLAFAESEKYGPCPLRHQILEIRSRVPNGL